MNGLGGITNHGSAVDLNDSGTAPRAAADGSAQLIQESGPTSGERCAVWHVPAPTVHVGRHALAGGAPDEIPAPITKPQPVPSQAAAQAEMASSPRAVSATYSPSNSPRADRTALPPVRKLNGLECAFIRCARGRSFAGRGTARRNLIHVRSPGRASKIAGYRPIWYRAGGRNSHTCGCNLRRPELLIAIRQPARFIRKNRDHLDLAQPPSKPGHHDLCGLTQADPIRVHSLVAPAFHEQKLTMGVNHDAGWIGQERGFFSQGAGHA